METWPSLALRLLARILQQGADFLERQGQKIEHWAEQVSSPDERASTGEDEPSPSSGEPPAHWLEKIESSEEPVRWIEHAGEEPPEYVPRALPRSPHAASSESSRFHHENREDPHHPATGERSARDERVRTEETTQQTPAASNEGATRVTPSPRFEKPTDESAAREQASRSQQHGTEEARGEHAPGSSASTSDPEVTSARDRTRSFQPARLQPAPAQNRPGRKREAAGERTESAEHTSSNPEQNADHAASPQPAAARFRKSDVSEDEPQPSPSLPNSSEGSSDSSRRLSSEPPTVRASSHSEHVAFGKRSPASSRAFSGPGRIERSERFPASAATSEVAYRSDANPSPTKGKEGIPTVRASRSHWPDLPDVDQIVREDVSASRRWERRIRNWERRQRLNREQQGRLWSA